VLTEHARSVVYIIVLFDSVGLNNASSSSTDPTA
jgi:hypothetical protein